MEGLMKPTLYLAAAASALACLVTTAQSAPFSDPRADRIAAIDTAGAN